MKLELKHLAPYLPYDLKCDIFFAQQSMGTCVWRIRILDCFYLDKLKNNLEFIQPILLPLSDLTKEIEVNGEKFVPIDILSGETYYDYELTKSNKLVEKDEKNIVILKCIDVYPYWIVQKLLQWHFDIFGLIDKGLAIDINTL